MRRCRVHTSAKQRCETASLMEMEAYAKKLGADVVVADIDYEVIGQSGSMMMMVMSGTVVK